MITMLYTVRGASGPAACRRYSCPTSAKQSSSPTQGQGSAGKFAGFIRAVLAEVGPNVGSVSLAPAPKPDRYPREYHPAFTGRPTAGSFRGGPRRHAAP